MPAHHVLLVTYHFPPSAASGTFRMLGFTRHLPKFGWRASVVAPPELPWEPVDAALTAQIPQGTAVHSVPYPRRAFKVLRWAAPWGVWLPPAWKACRRLLESHDIDAVLTSGPPHCVHALGRWAKRKFGVPWIADFRDPWLAGSPAATPRGVRGLWLRHWERNVMRHADDILANAPNATDAMRTAFPRWAHKISTLTNGFDPMPELVHAAERRAHIRLVHTGELYAGRDPRPLLDAVSEWNRQAAGFIPAEHDGAISPNRSHRRDEPGGSLAGGSLDLCIHLDIVGRTSQCGIDLESEIRQRALSESVTLHGQVSYKDAGQAMQDADVLVLLDSPGRTIGVPAKVYEYLGAGRPILALAEPDGDTAHILRQSGVLHRVVSPRLPERLPFALSDLIERLPEAALATGRLQFTRESLAGRLASIMNRSISTCRLANVFA